MRMYDIIEKKRDNLELTKEEINFFITNYVKEEIPDYQASALLMAIYINGMSDMELYNLTMAMATSSSVMDLSELKETEDSVIVDKHSTGGVGDKVTLIVLPIVAALGVKVFKMSGRGLGYTGGTADKVESIKGYDISKTFEESIRQIKEIGVCLVSQSDNLAVADKKIYALRDVTATVASIPLIASSIMSKKIASGVDKVVLDVTYGSGAFMPTVEAAKNLAEVLVKIGKMAGIETKCIITSMEEPLGKAVGNAIEIKEVISFLLADETTLDLYENKELKEVVLEISAHMMKMAGLGDDIKQNKIEALKAITSKAAYNKFIELIKMQGGHIHNVYMDWLNLSLDMPVLNDNAKYLKEIYAEKDGYIVAINSKKIGKALIELGGARNVKGEDIDYGVGFEFSKKVGSKVKKGDPILTVLYNDKSRFEKAFKYVSQAIYIDKVEQSVANVLKSKPSIASII